MTILLVATAVVLLVVLWATMTIVTAALDLKAMYGPKHDYRPTTSDWVGMALLWWFFLPFDLWILHPPKVPNPIKKYSNYIMESMR